MKKIHPRKFFETVRLREPYSPTPMGVQRRSKLLDIHPSCIITNQYINLPIFEVKYSYKTKRGNTKKGRQYLIAQENHEESWVEIEIKFFDEIQSMNKKNPYRAKENVEILSIELYGYATFNVGV